MLLDTYQCDADHVPLPLVSQATRWFLVYTRPALEAVAMQNLQQQGFEAYLPLYKRLKKADDAMVVIFEPMFPRYVFFRPSHSAQSIAPARSTRGVARLVSFGCELATLSSDVLQSIQQIEHDRNQADAAALCSLRPGHTVQFFSPAFRGLQGLVKAVSSRRVEVLLELMGRQQLISVERHQLKAA